MIVGEVGKDCHIEIDAFHALLRQAVRRNFHGAGFHARVDHIAKQTLQRDRVRRRQIRHERLVAIGNRNGSDIAAGGLRLAEVANNVGDGTLSVRSRHAVHAQIVAWTVVENPRRLIHRVERIVYTDIDYAGSRRYNRLGMHNRDGAFFNRLIDIVVTVARQTGQAEVHIAFFNRSRIEGQPFDVDGRGILEHF